MRTHHSSALALLGAFTLPSAVQSQGLLRRVQSKLIKLKLIFHHIALNISSKPMSPLLIPFGLSPLPQPKHATPLPRKCLIPGALRTGVLLAPVSWALLLLPFLTVWLRVDGPILGVRPMAALQPIVHVSQ